MKYHHLNIGGLLGTLVTLACCLEFGPILALLGAVGAGFLVNDVILAPILVGFLLLGAVGLWRNRRRHGRSEPLILHVVGAVAVLAFTFALYFQPAIWLSFAALIAATAWDVIARPQP